MQPIERQVESLISHWQAGNIREVGQLLADDAEYVLRGDQDIVGVTGPFKGRSQILGVLQLMDATVAKTLTKSTPVKASATDPLHATTSIRAYYRNTKTGFSFETEFRLTARSDGERLTHVEECHDVEGYRSFKRLLVSLHNQPKSDPAAAQVVANEIDRVDAPAETVASQMADHKNGG